MQVSAQEKLYYHYILRNHDLVEKTYPEFFEGSADIQVMFDIAKRHYLKFKSAPTCEQMKELVKIEAESGRPPVSDSVVDALYLQTNIDSYDETWLDETTKGWISSRTLYSALTSVIQYFQLKQADAQPGDWSEIAEHAKSMFSHDAVVTYADNPGLDFYDPAAHSQKVLERHKTGYPYIDTCLGGGAWSGMLGILIGGPKIGKSKWLQNLCAKSMSLGNNCAYITLELPEAMINQRIGSNLFNIPSLEYEKYANDETYMREKISAYSTSMLPLRPGALWVYGAGASTMSTNDLEALILKEEERRSKPGKPFKFKDIYIDYIGIMKNWRNPNTENTYMKLKQICEDLVAVAKLNKWSMWSVAQTNRTAADANDLFVSDIAESTGINQTCDIMFAICADQMMKADGRYKLKCLLDRVKPMDNTYMYYTEDKTYVRISENVGETWMESYSALPVQTPYAKGRPVNAPRRNDQQKSDEQQSQPQIGAATPVERGMKPRKADEGLFTDADRTLPEGSTGNNVLGLTFRDSMKDAMSLFVK